MQYEVIILELLTRIKKLENDVEELRAMVTSNRSVASEEGSVEAAESTEGKSSYTKLTDEMIMICYKSGKKLNQGGNPSELADMIADETGMNRNSAIMYLYAVSGMLGGTIYKRAISSKALKKYFDAIFNEYGRTGLKKAIKATRAHIRYRQDCGHTVDSIEEICDNYENKL